METRQAYQQKVEAQLKEWSARLGDLRVKAEKASEGMRQELAKDLAEARKKLDELKSASEEKWGHLRSGVETAWRDLAGAFDRVLGKKADTNKK
jgi:phage shock protein A